MKFMFLLVCLTACNFHSEQQAATAAVPTSPAVSSPAEITPASTAPVITSTPDTTIRVKVGAGFTIPLRVSLGSGFSWMLRDSLDAAYVQLVNTLVTTDTAESSARPDVQQFNFRAIKAGHTRLVFIHKRPWKKTASADDETKGYDIIIKP